MGKIFTSTEFVRRLKDCAMNYPTKYQNGTIGQYKNGYFLFDCICLIKSILWGWNGNKNATYGGAKYASNGVPDQTLDWFLAQCSNVSTDFSKIEVGEYLWMNGHCGIYIGDGLAVECTPAFLNKVLFTAVGNIGTKPNYGTRSWVKHGKLPYIDYAKQPTETDKLKAEIKELEEKLLIANETIDNLEEKVTTQEETIKLLEETGLKLNQENTDLKVANAQLIEEVKSAEKQLNVVVKENEKIKKQLENAKVNHKIIFKIGNYSLCKKIN